MQNDELRVHQIELDQLLEVFDWGVREIARSLPERFLRAVSKFLEILLLVWAIVSHRVIPLKT